MYIVITGTSRGIGLELTELALSKGHHVLAIARKPETSPLSELSQKYPKLEILRLDLVDQHAQEKVLEAVKNWPKVDVLINNAGIYRDDEKLDDFQESFLVNAIKPLFITRTLIPFFKKSARPISLQITSMMGSLEDNLSGGAYSYRASKAALNMLFKCLSIDEKWLISLQVHPGWVQTRMGGENAPIHPKDSALGIWELIEKAGPEQSGSFLTYQGKKIPW